MCNGGEFISNADYNRFTLQEKCFQYWPEDRSARHQYFIVDPVAEQEFQQFVIRDFKVKDARVIRKCIVGSFICWILVFKKNSFGIHSWQIKNIYM